MHAFLSSSPEDYISIMRHGRRCLYVLLLCVGQYRAPPLPTRGLESHPTQLSCSASTPVRRGASCCGVNPRWHVNNARVRRWEWECINLQLPRRCRAGRDRAPRLRSKDNSIAHRRAPFLEMRRPLQTDTGTALVRRITVSSGVVRTLAGTAGVFGHADGIGSAAVFSMPYAVATDATGSVAFIVRHRF